MTTPSGYMNMAVPAVITWLFIRLSIFSEAVPEYRYHDCPNTTTFTPNSIYQSNLNQVLSSLTSNSTRDTGFYNTSIGQDPGTVVYGLFLCRGDVTINMCQECLTTAAKDLVETYCPIEKVAVIWYDHCMVRYSNESFFGNMVQDPSISLYNIQDISEPVRFNQLLQVSMNDSRTKAVDAPTGAKRFGTKEATFTSSDTLYTLVQCTPDLNSSDCDRCLRGMISGLMSCCYGKRGGNVLNPSCNIRYEIYPFYQLAAAPTPTPGSDGPTPGSDGKSQSSTTLIISITAPVAFVLFLSSVAFYFLRRRATDKYKAIQERNDGNEITTVESLQLDLSTIKAATNNFSDGNKLGEGGFGEVFKGTLPNGQHIAAKRLSGSSRQGAEEFKTEVLLVAKLQHRNLARLLGFCLEGEEKILVYEFVPNNSLDHFLFGHEKQGRLDWSIRYKIINGVARGVLYLHEDSRLKIIHRDLKSSNILLDKEMNPKISDFGMARIFGVDQTHANTSRIVGTYGYMSPEYAFYGQFSVKSDVYSFGVLILEIITGKKNSSFLQSDGAMDLLSYAWKHWTDGTILEILDPSLGNSYSRNEVIRCIQIGLLCVEEDPVDRPTMATVVLMLSSYSVSLALPRKPAFFLRTRTDGDMPSIGVESDNSTSKSKSTTINDMSISEIFPR
ncbi:cysteine-rich receptor-like protein kinase 25 [Ziziphus jujuba]|uniref:Cysteine-rich receptor-like protein kinase 25 n=1 Tax=Ziziphus jujuba TaxID=326968 RepID=A0A6P3YWD9_ZIZJJ|nr:cysteine-rich receptor-like protein kinase 25 [Ziziphus jujuba]